jgi:hypothetical protein
MRSSSRPKCARKRVATCVKARVATATINSKSSPPSTDRADPRRRSQSREVGRRPVGAIHHRAHVARRTEPASFGESRHRRAERAQRLGRFRQRRQLRLLDRDRQTRAARAERSGHGDRIAGEHAAAQLAIRGAHFADHRDRETRRGRAHDVAAGDRAARCDCERGHTAIAVENPRRIRRRSDRECDRREHRRRTHRRNIGKIGRERPMTGLGGRHRRRGEVHALDQRVGRDDAAMRTRRLPHRRIVADPDQ